MYRNTNYMLCITRILIRILFQITEAFAQILGTKEKIIKSGSKLQLHCILKKATEEPLYVFWYVSYRNTRIQYTPPNSILHLWKRSTYDVSLGLFQLKISFFFPFGYRILEKCKKKGFSEKTRIKNEGSLERGKPTLCIFRT